ncbi:MAG: hypothetical protein JKY65_24370 [Planctomycetes bacterium]|nr:hypothetical protein [Planctomycetota bacterium]
MAMEQELAEVLRSATKSLTVRELRKAKIDNVKVIERSQLIDLLAQLQLEGALAPAEDSTKERRRVDRLLQENAKLGKEKSQLEHAKGLVEAERGRLQASVDEITQAVGRELGSKLQSEDVRELLAERKKLQQQTVSLEKTLKKLQQTARNRLDEELGRKVSLEEEVASLMIDRDRLRKDVERYEGEHEALRRDLEQFRDERDRMVDERDSMASERDAFRDERDRMRNERDDLRLERDEYLKSFHNQTQETDTFRRRIAELEREVTELHMAREQDATQLSELTQDRESLALQLAELAPPVDEEEISAPTETSAEPPRSARRGNAGKNVGFGFGFGGTKPRR